MITKDYTHLGLFEGIGGFSLAAHLMGWKTTAWCEWNPFGQHVLKSLFPEAEGFSDITKTDFTKYANRIDIITGGFPCQPFSTAGKRKGTDDARYLWPEMLRAIREIRPRWVVGENVYGLVNWDGGLVFDTVCADLENEGFKVWPVVLPAAGVNAPHRRDRIWFIAFNPFGGRRGEDGIERSMGKVCRARNNDKCQTAESDTRSSQNPNEDGRGSKEREGEPGIREQRHTGAGDNERIPTNDGEAGILADTNGFGLRGEGDWAGNAGFFGENDAPNDWSAFPTIPPLCSGNDGISELLDADTVSEVAGKKVRNAFSWWRQESIKAGGNAIVPQVALQIFRAINEFEEGEALM